MAEAYLSANRVTNVPQMWDELETAGLAEYVLREGYHGTRNTSSMLLRDIAARTEQEQVEQVFDAHEPVFLEATRDTQEAAQVNVVVRKPLGVGKVTSYTLVIESIEADEVVAVKDVGGIGIGEDIVVSEKPVTLSLRGYPGVVVEA